MALACEPVEYSEDMESTSELVVDELSKRLLELTAHNDRNEDDLDDIINILSEKAPKLLEGLRDSRKENVAKTCYVKIYADDEVIFQQGDAPDAYYTVIRGAVSIYAHFSNNAGTDDGDERA